MYPSSKSNHHILYLVLLLVILSYGCGGSGDATITDTTPVPVISKIAAISYYTGNGILSWGTPTLYSDGTTTLVTTDIQGYRVYVATASGDYYPGSYYFVTGSTTTNVAVKSFNLPEGQYYFVITTLTTTNLESYFSPEVPALLTNPTPTV